MPEVGDTVSGDSQCYSARALAWGQCGDPYGPYTDAKIAYQSFPDPADLRWLGLRDRREDGGSAVRGAGRLPRG